MKSRLTPLLPLLFAVALITLCALTAPADNGNFALPVLGVVVTAGLSPKQLLETRGNLIADARKIIDKADEEKRDLTDEENAKFDEMVKDADECKRVVDEQHARAQAIANRRQQLDQADDEIKNFNLDPLTVRGSAAPPTPQGAPTPEDRGLAIQGWLINQSSRSDITLEQKHVDAANRMGIRLNAEHLVLDLDRDYANCKRRVMNALQTTSGGSGGYLRPEGFHNALETAMLWFGGMLNVAEVMRTSTAAPFPWPTGNDTTNTGRQIGEAKAVNANNDPSFAQTWLYAYKFTSDEILVSYELLRDTPFSLEAIIGEMLGTRLGRVLNTKCTTGTGAGTCQGIVTAAPVGKTTASGTAITSDELLDLMHSVDRAYRDMPGVGWMMHDNVTLALRKLKDSNGRYHWVDGMDAGEPNRLFTKPVTINNDMASSIASGNKTVLFGHFPHYKIRQVGNVRLKRLKERHAENDQDAFLAFNEFDGRLLDAGGNPIKSMQQV